ncbi:MAG: hypothetical protein MUC95_09940 [Spirochaetes bacterium]|jgi:hypothetical protein|nr:hypothetical protein [Spirochaetota bacterium]
MKIDIDSLLQAKGRIDSGSGLKQAAKRDAIPDTANPGQSIAAVQNISNARALIDAMAISQIAQNLMSRAIEITSKLRDIARSAVASGKVNVREFQDAISETKSSFNKIQETFTAPVISEVAVNTGSIKIEVPGMKKEAELLAEFEAAFSGGNKPGNNNIEKIDLILYNLQDGSRLISNFYGQLKNVFGITGSDNINYQNLVPETAGSISGKPDAAIRSQGNINPDNAKILLGSQLL